MEEIKGFMTTMEAAKYMKLTQSQICWICNKGGFKGACRFGRTWAIPVQSVKDYRPAPKGFAATREAKNRQAAAELAELNATIRAAKGLPADDSENNNVEERGQDTRSGSYITIEDAAKIFGLATRTVRQFCQWGKIAGAQKLRTNKSWVMPYDEVKKISVSLRRRIKRPVLQSE